MKKSNKLIIGFVVLLSVIFGSYYFSNQYVSKQLFSQHRREMIDEANVILYATDISDWSHNIEESQQKLIEEIAEQNNQRISIVSPTGQLVFDSDSDSDGDLGENLGLRKEVSQVLSGNQIGSDMRMSATLEHTYYYVAVPVMKEGKLVGILRLSEKADVFLSNINQFKKLILMLLITFTILVALLTWNVRVYQKRRELELTTVLSGIKKGEYTDKYLLTDNGQLSVLGKTVRDLADEMEQQSKEFYLSEQRFEELLDTLNIGVMVISKERQILMTNPVIKTILMMPVGDLSKEYYHYLPGVELFEQVEQVFENGQIYSGKIELNQRWYEVKAHSILREHQQQVLVMLHDITDVQNLLEHQRDFISNISHELKTPVTAIKGFSETLLGGAKDEPALNEEFLEIISQESQRLEKLIEEILDLSALNASLPKEQETIDVSSLVDKIVKNHKVIIEEKSLMIHKKVSGHCIVKANTEQLLQLVDNIFTNSLKYTKQKGEITIHLKEQSETVQLEILDNGIGIPEEDLTRIFERFYRVDKARTSNIKGTGLGLSIVKEIVEQLQGTIEVTSKENQWTKISITLPKEGNQ